MFEKYDMLIPQGVIFNLKEIEEMKIIKCDMAKKLIYNNELEADATVKETLLSTNEDIDILHVPVELIDTAGCSFDELQNPETLSLSNKGEADLLFKHLDLLLQQYQLSGETTKIDIGIISPYKEQIELLKEKLAEFAA